jgi:glycosyltransferase involved in cell wall biosynthesis/ubiquinone/menaquinone biosynthesis C-methylase UbiE
MKLTIAVCTYNRFDWLAKCLNSIQNQTLLKTDYKLLVIDNSLNPKESKKFLKSLGTFENLEYIITDRCGIGYARTIAMEKCSTEFLAFTDDDCLVSPDWGENILKAFARHGDGVGVIGGCVAPNWESQRPDWLEDDLLHQLGLINWSNKDIFIDHSMGQWLLTANAAYRTKALRAAGGFPLHLGRKRKLPLAQEEFAANNAISALGFDLLYSQTLKVQHFVPVARAKQKMFCRDAFWDGVSQFLYRSQNVDMDDVDKLSDVLIPLQEKILTGFNEFSSSNKLKEKIAQMRNAGWELAHNALKEKAAVILKKHQVLPVIYIITPCLNAVKTIDQTIMSVVNQAGDFSIRYHIQDGDSTDGTIEKLEQWDKRLQVGGSFPLMCNNVVFTYSSNPDKNMYDAVCKGFETMYIPHKSFMSWINSDDILFPGALACIINLLDLENISWVGGLGTVIRDNRIIWQGDRWLNSEVIKNGLCDGIHWEFVQQEGTFFRKALWDKSGCSREISKFNLAGDWNMWRLFAHFEEFYQVTVALGAFCLQAGQLSEQMDTYLDEINSVLPSEKRLICLNNLPAKLSRKLLVTYYPQGDVHVKTEISETIVPFFQQRIHENKIQQKQTEPNQTKKKRQISGPDNSVKKQQHSTLSSVSLEVERPEKQPEPIINFPEKRLFYPVFPDPAKIFFGLGWYAPEGKKDNWWRWSSHTGFVHLKTGRGGKSNLVFSFLSEHMNNSIHLRLNGKTVATIAVSRDEKTAGPFKINLKRGTNILEFSSDKKLMASQKNPRQLNFMIKNLDFVKPKGLPASLGQDSSLSYIKESGVFFTSFYKKQIPDPGLPSHAEHYLLYGAWENKNPNHLFDSYFYLENNRDVYCSGENPLLHYLRQGWREGRDPHPQFSTLRYLNNYPEIVKTGINPLQHYLKYGILEYKDPCLPSRVAPKDFQQFTFSRRSHWELFIDKDEELFSKKEDMDECTLKIYQDLLVFTFIKDNVTPGSRILDVGGGCSRILDYFSETYDCWNIDKMEGMGNGPKQVDKFPYRLILDYMGNFNPELPDNSFDFVFSISALEHTPEDEENFNNIIKDINRVLKPGGYSLHLFDVKFISDGGFWTNKIVHTIFNTVNTINKWTDPETVKDDPDIYYMSESVYNKTWIHTTKQEYAIFGKPASLNILWRKAV